MRPLKTIVTVAIAALFLSIAPARAQQADSDLGAPGPNTATPDGRYLPNPPPPFKGEIDPNAVNSKPYWPTILEAAGLPEPVSVNGVAQRPIEGTSMVYTWDKADVPGRHTTQYFEMFGSRAIYHDGWIASAPPPTPPWVFGKPTPDVMNDFKWELYNIEQDWTQSNDLAAKMPDKLRDMRQLFIMQAAKYNVFPLDATRLSRFISIKHGQGRSVGTRSAGKEIGHRMSFLSET